MKTELRSGFEGRKSTAKDNVTARAFYPELLPLFTPMISRLKEAGPGEAHPAPRELANTLLSDAFELGASDIHIEPHREGARIRVRVDGTIRDVVHLSTQQGKTVVNQFKAFAGLDPIARFTPQDAHARMQCNGNSCDIRLALAPTLDRETLAIRLLDPKRLERSVTELGLTSSHLQRLTDWLEEVSGIFLSTGPTGSGKTTTLYAMLHSLKMMNRVILSLEDPVEYQIDGVSQIKIDELHEFQFAQGIKALLRHDPDYLMVGEIRDRDSAHTAVHAAISGRVLLSTMHARDCVGAISALRNWNLADHEIGESLSVVVAQRLIRKLCIHCSNRRDLTDSEAAWFATFKVSPPRHVWEGEGCAACRHLGYKGRTGLFELWKLDESDYQMILHHTDEHALRVHLCEKGHRFLISEALAALDQGITTVSEVRRATAGTVPMPCPTEKKLEHVGI
jgi:general secretion pathway protein E